MKTRLVASFFVTLVMAAGAQAFAQSMAGYNQQPPPPAPDVVVQSTTPVSPDEKPAQGPFALSLGVAGFAALVVAALVFLRHKGGLGESYFFRLVGLALVVQAGLFLIVAGYTQQQIMPMLGLLGTVAGYMLGKGEDGKS